MRFSRKRNICLYTRNWCRNTKFTTSQAEPLKTPSVELRYPRGPCRFISLSLLLTHSALPSRPLSFIGSNKQYLLPANSTVYVGCVGKDDFAAQLRAATKNEGVRTEYMTVDTSTGKCGVVITGHHRSLVTDLGAANEYKLDHLKSPEIWKLVEGAKYYYVGGYHLTVCPPAIVELGKHAAENNKVPRTQNPLPGYHTVVLVVFLFLNCVCLGWCHCRSLTAGICD